MKSIPLIIGNLKSFMRNWRSVMLLIVVPLLLIGLVFMSLNSSGMSKIRVGVIGGGKFFDPIKYSNTALSFLKMYAYESLDMCLWKMKIYEEYACIDINEEDRTIKVYFDNTRDPIIWETVDKIERSIDYINKQKASESITGFMTGLNETGDKVKAFETGLLDANKQLEDYTKSLGQYQSRLSAANNDLRTTLTSMDSDISDAQSEIDSLDATSDQAYSESTQSITAIRYVVAAAGPNASILYPGINNEINVLEMRVNSGHNQVENRVDSANSKLENYRNVSAKGWTYSRDIGNEVRNIDSVKLDLMNAQSEIQDSMYELEEITAQMNEVLGTNSESLLRPIGLSKEMAYVHGQADTQRSGSLLNLQIIYPKLLLLLTIFLSLLISSFITLQDINSPAQKRIKLVRRMFMPEMISSFLSSLLIVMVPIFCVILLGQFLFNLDIFSYFGFVLFLVIMTSSCFILLGMSISYLVRKESMALLFTTFILVFLLFISGFLYPIERMAESVIGFASSLPSTIALNAFFQVVFYGQYVGANNILLGMFGWFLLFFIITIIVKAIKK